VKSKDGSGQNKVFTFVDAVGEFGSLLTGDDLAQAYRRAGSIYQGMVTRCFVVLKDKPHQPVCASKRPRENDSGVPSSKIDRFKRFN